jgi:hypothetical protein
MWNRSPVRPVGEIPVELSNGSVAYPSWLESSMTPQRGRPAIADVWALTL